jgi:hypothetical protein
MWHLVVSAVIAFLQFTVNTELLVIIKYNFVINKNVAVIVKYTFILTDIETSLVRCRYWMERATLLLRPDADEYGASVE